MNTVITKKAQSNNLVKPSVVLYARRYKKPQKRWHVELRTGWGIERVVHSDLSRSQARILAKNFLEG